MTRSHLSLLVLGVAIAGLVIPLGLSACATEAGQRASPLTERQGFRAADPRFPHAYESAPGWTALTPEGPLYRPDVGVARELHAKFVGKDLAVGTILLKEEYPVVDGRPGPLGLIGIMRRTDDPAFAATGGWSFESYDPKTKSRTEQDTASCIGCHSLRANDDWRFRVGATAAQKADPTP